MKKQKLKSKDQILEKIILNLSNKHKENLGYCKMTYYILNLTSIKHNHKKIYHIMKKLNIPSKIRFKKYNYEKKIFKKQYDYLINRDFSSKKPYQKLFTDVSYIEHNDYSKTYLSPIIDVYNNEIVSYNFVKRNDFNLIVIPFKKTLNKINYNVKVIINSNHELIYFSKDYKKIVDNKLVGSMSRIRNCLDNRLIEYWFSIFKHEWLYKIPFKKRSFNKVKNEINKFIIYYNKERIQSCLDYKSPYLFKKEKGYQLSTFWSSIYLKFILKIIYYIW